MKENIYAYVGLNRKRINTDANPPLSFLSLPREKPGGTKNDKFDNPTPNKNNNHGVSRRAPFNTPSLRQTSASRASSTGSV